jgi:SNF family Na+-dependent transporter
LGVKSIGKVVYVTSTLPYLLLLIVFAKGLTLEGSGFGIGGLFAPEWKRLGKAVVWKDASQQVLFSTGVAYGPVLYYGSARIEHNKILMASVAMPIIDLITSIVGGITIFAYLGHVASLKEMIELSDVVENGPQIIFVTLPSIIGTMGDSAGGWLVVFYLMCILFGIATVFGYFSYYMQLIKDAFPGVGAKVRPELQVLAITILSFIFSLMFVTEGGFHNFLMFDRHSGTVSLVFVLLLQTIMIPWIYGFDKFATLIKIRTDETVPKPMVFIIKTFVPLYSFVILIISLVEDIQAEYPEELGYNVGFVAGTKILWIFPILIILLGAAKPLAEQENFDDLVEHQYGIRFIPEDQSIMAKLTANSHSYNEINKETLKKRTYKYAVKAWNKEHGPGKL